MCTRRIALCFLLVIWNQEVCWANPSSAPTVASGPNDPFLWWVTENCYSFFIPLLAVAWTLLPAFPSYLFIFFFCLFPCTSRLLRPAEAEKNIKFHSNCLKTDIFNHHRMRFVVFFMFLSASHCFFVASIFLFCWRIAEPALFAHSHFLSLTHNHNIRTIYTVNSFVRCCCWWQCDVQSTREFMRFKLPGFKYTF